LRRALERQPDHSPAVVALAELLALDGRRDEALEILAKIPETAETRRIAALARTGAPAEGDGDVSGRLDALLPKVKDDADARQEYLDLLEVLGPDDPRTREYRKQLTAQLF
jgi:putative thioredoxin